MTQSVNFQRPDSTVETFCFFPVRYCQRQGIARFSFGAGSNAAIENWSPDDDPRRLLPHYFEELLFFPDAPRELSAERLENLQAALELLGLVLGISYFKALLPQQIQVLPQAPDNDTADFVSQLYHKGLGEFAWQNRLNLDQHCHFPGSGADAATLPAPGLAKRDGIAFGGGMGSTITAQALKAAGRNPLAVSVATRMTATQDAQPTRAEPHPAISAGAKTLEIPLLCIGRLMDQSLLDYNRRGAWNGHIPVTAIISLIMVCAAMIYDFDTVIMSNEASTDEGNHLFLPGLGEINHQWSKSLEFETLLSALLARRFPTGPSYFSLLRPWSELQLAKLLGPAGMAESRASIASCNRLFRLHRSSAVQWCCKCAKCHFMFLIMAPWLPRQTLSELFGRGHPRAQSSQAATRCLISEADSEPQLRALLGLTAAKPFECVGSRTECRAALQLLSRHSDWQDEPIISCLLSEIAALKPSPAECLSKLEREPTPELLPADYRNVINALQSTIC